jgi:hypothetical protein
MSDTLGGLTRRVQSFSYEQETGEELSHLLDEAREDCDGADALIELALGDNLADIEFDDDLNNLVAEAAELDDIDFDEGEDEDISEEDIASATAELDELDEDEDDESAFEEGAIPGEIFVI